MNTACDPRLDSDPATPGRDRIRSREIELDGSLNPNLADFGIHSPYHRRGDVRSAGLVRGYSVVVMIPLCVIGRKSARGVAIPVLNPLP